MGCCPMGYTVTHLQAGRTTTPLGICGDQGLLPLPALLSLPYDSPTWTVTLTLSASSPFLSSACRYEVDDIDEEGKE